MALLFHRNEKTVKDIYEDFINSRLTVDLSYQRRKVWLPQDKTRLIETILLELVIPEVFFWTSTIDAETGDMVTHIVDGQQRISSIVEFISGGFPLSSKYLMDKSIMEKSSDKFFIDLEPLEKTKIWQQKISVVNIDSSFTREHITQMFYRLNLTNYSLNEQEKRNSKESAFGDAAIALSEYDFWKNCKVFSSADARRMKDVEFCCSIYILASEGVVDQTNSKKINAYYDDFAEVFDSEFFLYGKIEKAMDIISSLNDKTTISFISKKAQIYSLFSVVFKMLDNGIAYSSELFERFKLFVLAYNRFRNEYEYVLISEAQQRTNEAIKKYKLASSEGINKLGNRMIRLETLYGICIDSPPSIKDTLMELEDLYEKQKTSGKVGFEPFDPEDINDIKESD